jgi:hypothetical protein
MLTLSGCGTDERAVAIEEALSVWQGANPQIYKLEVPDWDEQLKEFPDEAPFTIDLRVSVSDPSAITRDLLPIGDSIEVDTDVSTITDSTYGQLRNAVRAQLSALVREADNIPMTDVTVPLRLSDTDTGWVAEVNGAPISADFDGALVSAALPLTWQWNQIGAELSISRWKSDLFPSATSSFNSFVSVDSITPVEGVPNKFTAEVSYPDAQELFEALAKAAYDSYNAGSEPIFGTLTEAAFETKMGTQNVDIAADQHATAELTVTTPAPEELPYGDMPTDGIATELSLMVQVTVQSLDVDATVPDSAKSEIIKPLLDDLNKNKVVKAVKLPTTKVLTGKSSGTKMKVTSKGDPHTVITIKKGDKVVMKVMIRAKKSLTFRLPKGTYTFILGFGPNGNKSTWYGNKYTFGPEGTYRKLTYEVGASRVGNRIYTYLLDINMNGGGNLSSTGAPYEY